MSLLLCRCWLCCLPPLDRGGLVIDAVHCSGEIILTAQQPEGQPHRLGLPRCGATPLRPVLLCKPSAGPLLLPCGVADLLVQDLHLGAEKGVLRAEGFF